MTLEAGTKLGRYKIRSKIGEGGMGDVYLTVKSSSPGIRVVWNHNHVWVQLDLITGTRNKIVRNGRAQLPS
jgi:hypothetical protein